MARNPPFFIHAVICCFSFAIFNKMRDKALQILQKETGSFEESSRLRDDVLDAMIAFKKGNVPSDEEIKQANMFKLLHKKRNISYIDCIGYNIALFRNVKFLTGDKQFADFSNVEFVK